MKIIQAVLMTMLLLAFPTSEAVASVNLLETGDDASMSLRDFIDLAFEQNPDIRAARSSWRAMVESYPQVTSLPDPTLNMSWFPEPIETRNGSNDFGIQLMQMIPNPRRLDIMGDIALTRAEMARVSYEKTVRDVLTNVLNSYFELGYLHSAIGVATTNKLMFAQLVELGDLEYSNSNIGLSELYTAESRLAQAEYEEFLLIELLHAEESRMRSLLGAEPDWPVPPIIALHPQTIELDLEQLRDNAISYRHELEMAGIAVEIADLGISLAEAADDPNFSLGLMYNFIGSSPMDGGMRTSGDDAWGIMFGISIPVWNDRNDAAIAQAEHELERALSDLESRENQTYADVDRLYWRLLNQQRLVDLYRDTLLPEAISAVELSQTWYEADQAPYSSLVETRLVIQNFQLALARAETDYLKTLAELQKLTGDPVFADPQEVTE